MSWRVGKNYSRTCPACPRTPSYCLNTLTETTQFTTSDTIWAIYETQCVGTSPISPVNWYKKDTSGNWLLVYSWTPSQAYPTAMEAYLNPTTDGCYKVEYSTYSTQFTIGSGCAPVCTNPKYKCVGTSCISDNCDGSGIYTTSNCNNSCTGGGGTTTCPGCDLTKNYCISGSCIPKTYIVIGTVGFFALMMLRR